MLDDEVIESLSSMIISKNVEDRRIALTILFNQFDEIDERDINHLSILYFTNLEISKYHSRFKTNKRSLEETVEDVEFIIRNVCDDENKLTKIFLFNITEILEQIKNENKDA